MSTFVNNLDDIAKLMKSVSPKITKFFENGFNETKFTKRTNNLDWDIESDIKVFGYNSLGVNNDLFHSLMKSTSGVKENTIVKINVLKIGWIFNRNESGFN